MSGLIKKSDVKDDIKIPNVNKELKAELKIIAKYKDVTLSKMIRTMLREFRDKNEFILKL